MIKKGDPDVHNPQMPNASHPDYPENSGEIWESPEHVCPLSAVKLLESKLSDITSHLPIWVTAHDSNYT
jgi:hypothetical protein